MEVLLYSELTQEIKKELYDYNHNSGETFEEFDLSLEQLVTVGGFENFAEYIREWGEVEHSVNGDSIISEYTLDTENYRFSVYGSQYIKDNGLCDFQLYNPVSVIPLSEIEDMITITKKEYDELLEIKSQYELLTQ